MQASALPAKPPVYPRDVFLAESLLIKFLHNTHTERIRLSGFDCPEKRHLPHPALASSLSTH